MNDQASTLREMTAPALRAETLAGLVNHAEGAMSGRFQRARTVAVTGGKGGVGKSNFAVNVALELAALGNRVSLFDADLALANADVLLGLNPRYHLGHVLSGQRRLDEVIIKTRRGVRLLPGGSGVEELASLTNEQHTQLVAELRAMEHESDFMLIDTAAGIGVNVTGVLRAADEVVLVTTPDPTAVVDAYATLKVLHRHSPSKPVWVVVNDVVGVGDADQTFHQIAAAAARFLKHPVELLGMIPRDASLAEAVREQTPVVERTPDAPSCRGLRLIAKRLVEETRRRLPHSGPHGSFWLSLSETSPVR
jgi:flagellar biosynthesis protein FlhG